MTPTPEFDLRTDEQGRLVLQQPGTDEVAGVRIRRAFPWSKPNEFVSIRSAEGKELIMVEDVSRLRPEVAAKVQQALDSGTLIPVIRQITELVNEFGHQQWTVETDRGRRSFRVAEKEDLRFLPDGRFTVRDADGNLYLIPRIEQLDPVSGKYLEIFV